MSNTIDTTTVFNGVSAHLNDTKLENGNIEYTDVHVIVAAKTTTGATVVINESFTNGEGNGASAAWNDFDYFTAVTNIFNTAKTVESEAVEIN